MAGSWPTTRRTEISPWVWTRSNSNAAPQKVWVGMDHRAIRLPKAKRIRRIKRQSLRNRFSPLAKRLRNRLAMSAKAAAAERKYAWNNPGAATKDGFLLH